MSMSSNQSKLVVGNKMEPGKKAHRMVGNNKLVADNKLARSCSWVVGSCSLVAGSCSLVVDSCSLVAGSCSLGSLVVNSMMGPGKSMSKKVADNKMEDCNKSARSLGSCS
jgi:hypothetical protein